MASFTTYSPACDLADRQLRWVAYRNGSLLIQHGAPTVLTAVAIAGAYRKRYGKP